MDGFGREVRTTTAASASHSHHILYYIKKSAESLCVVEQQQPRQFWKEDTLDTLSESKRERERLEEP